MKALFLRTHMYVGDTAFLKYIYMSFLWHKEEAIQFC